MGEEGGKWKTLEKEGGGGEEGIDEGELEEERVSCFLS